MFRFYIQFATLSLALSGTPAAEFEDIQPLLKQYCLYCHSTEKLKGDLDLERFSSMAEVLQDSKVWESVLEQLHLGEMPPKEKPQPTPEQREQLLSWIDGTLQTIAEARAGDPGPVVLRRLSNAEYTSTIRDLTGVNTLNPAREFPADSASGEGFMNVGHSLVTSPALLTKYLDAAKQIVRHAVLLPHGIAFSPSIFQRDWTEERLAAIRAFYAQFTDRGEGFAVNLQGIKFDTKDGGVIPLEKYFAATIQQRHGTPPDTNLNRKYFATLWSALNSHEPSILLDDLRKDWRAAKVEDAPKLAATVRQWQQVLWRFAPVGHIGKRDGPKAWQTSVTPIADQQEIRLKLPAAKSDAVTLYLAVSNGGDGNTNDLAVWERPRLVAPGRPDLLLRDLPAFVANSAQQREKIVFTAAKYLAAAAGLAEQQGLDPALLQAWLAYLGLNGETKIENYITAKTESVSGYDFVKGWTGADALSVLANSSDQHVRIPGNLKPRSIAVHPAPQRRVAIGWRSPAETSVNISGTIQHAHPECGNGVTWAIELRKGTQRQRLAAGTAQGGKEDTFPTLPSIAVKPGDLIALVIGPRDGNHSCDLTMANLVLKDSEHEWNLWKDVSPNILAGNPHGLWHFFNEPEKAHEPTLPAGSLLAKWSATASNEEKSRIAAEVESLLKNGVAHLDANAPDTLLYRQLMSAHGPLLSQLSHQAEATPDSRWGVQAAAFENENLVVRAPSVIEIRLPADLAEGSELVATAKLHGALGREGSVQMQVLTARPALLGLTAGTLKEHGSKGTWSDGERPAIADSPILVAEGSAARRRIETDLAEFRDLFPAALCYTKIVPVDEVVTLSLFYREDDHLRRLMLDDRQAAEIDRLWDELRYISQEPLKLVDVFEQLWQYATQDADPSAFEPLREPIKQRAARFRESVARSEKTHLDWTLHFATLAYRRPVTQSETSELRALYEKLRAEEIPHDEAIRLTLARILVSPAFLYRSEKPVGGPVNDWELATRLSYFLWSSMPDAELRSIAAEGRLREPAVLVAQARRMIRDPRVRRLATEFGCAWLHIHGFDELSEKSERHFPAFNALKGAMYDETILFFTDLFQRDGSILELIDADHAFLNEELAGHYQIPGVQGAELRRVNGVKSFSRGGVLAQAATLAKQSGASRTSPILRGNWISEVLLGEKLPRPPKDVPQLPEDEATETLTVRELTEKHSSDPRCYGCHRRIDPYGYALEAFDPIGRQRERDLGGRKIDTHAKTIDGAEFDGIEGLKQYLLNQRRDTFLKQFSRKLLGYALGRSVMLSDGPLITEMTAQLKAHNYRFSTALETIVRSKQFREIRGPEMADH